MKQGLAVAWLAAALSGTAAAAPADSVETTVGAQFAFGSGRLVPGLSAGVELRAGDEHRTLSRITLTPHELLATLAGAPVFARRLRLDAAGDDDFEAEDRWGQKTGKWLFGAAGVFGAVMVIGLSSGGGGGDETTATPSSPGSTPSSDPPCNGANVGTVCVPCGSTGPLNGCLTAPGPGTGGEHWGREPDEAWLVRGTGWMGDLLPRE